MKLLILNRQTQELPQDGWYQIEVTGEHPAGKDRVQVIDAVALQSICNRFQSAANDPHFPGLLIDADHLSHNLGHSTEALGWLREVEQREGQLWGQIDWTDIGKPAVLNKRFKFFSTEYDRDDLEAIDGKKVRPLALAGLSLTNRPNNRGGKPISNSDRQQPGTTQEEPNKKMQTIAEKLGLPPESTEEAILAKIAELQTKLTEYETKMAEAEAETVMNRFADRVMESERPKWRAALIKNRADTEALLNGLPLASRKEELKNKSDTAPLRNRAVTPAPIASGHAEEPPSDGIDAKAAASIRNRATELVNQSRRTRGFAECWSQAESEYLAVRAARKS